MRIFYILFFLLPIMSFAQESWIINGEMELHVSGAEAVVRDDKVLILGGKVGPLFANVSVPVIQEYNPATGLWECPFDSSLTCYGMLTARADFMSGLLGDTIVYCGGTGDFSFFTSMEILTANASPNSLLTNNEFNRSNASGLIHNGNFYMIGGYTIATDSSFISYIAAYDVGNQTIVYQDDSTFQPFDTPFDQMVAAVGDYIYIFGGTRFGVLADAARFNTLTFELENLAPMPTVRAGGVAVATDDGLIYVMGGYNETQPLSSAWIYDTNADPDSAWTEGPTMNIARHNFMGVAYEDRIIIMGGYDAVGLGINEIEELAITPVAIEQSPPPLRIEDFRLYPNFPNPFNGGTTIEYELPVTTDVRLNIYDVNGRLVRELVSGRRSQGRHQVNWDARNDRGNEIGSGIYFAVLHGANFQQTQKMIYAR